MNVLIIEDEPFAQNELKRLLSNTDKEINVLGCIDSVEDCIDWFTKNPAPDLVFMDIQLSDGLSFEIFNSLKIKSPIIFTTAYDEYAIQAFKVNSIDYLLKPIEPNALKNALAKFDELKEQYSTEGNSNISNTQLEKLLELSKPKNEYKSRIIARVGDQIKYVETSEIAFFFAEDNEVMLISKNSNRYIIDYSLNQLVDMLDPKIFNRINRSYIIHIDSIQKIHKYFNSRLRIELLHRKSEIILISRVNVPKFLEWIEG